MQSGREGRGHHREAPAVGGGVPVPRLPSPPCWGRTQATRPHRRGDSWPASIGPSATPLLHGTREGGHRLQQAHGCSSAALGARTWLWAARAASQDRPGFWILGPVTKAAWTTLLSDPSPSGLGPRGPVTRRQWGELCPRGAALPLGDKEHRAPSPRPPHEGRGGGWLPQDPCPAVSAPSTCWDSISPLLVFL